MKNLLKGTFAWAIDQVSTHLPFRARCGLDNVGEVSEGEELPLKPTDLLHLLSHGR